MKSYFLLLYKLFLVVHFYFKKYLKEATLNFSIEDLGTYTGEVKFKIATDKINNEPSLKL